VAIQSHLVLKVIAVSLPKFTGINASILFISRFIDFLIIMAPCVADADIIFLSFGFVYLLLFFLLILSRGCLPYFHTRCGLSANLRYRSVHAASVLPHQFCLEQSTTTSPKR